MISFLLLLACILSSTLASIFLKMGISNPDKLTLLSLISNWKIWLGAFFYASAFLGYIYTLRLVPLSLAQPVITAGVSAITALVATLFFREQMLLGNWFGLFLIFMGIFFLFYGRV